MEKIKVRKFIKNIYFNYTGSFEMLVLKLTTEMKNLKKEGYENIEIEKSKCNDGYSIYGTILENDVDFEIRKITLEKIEKEERETYERLKKKFEKPSPPSPPKDRIIREGQSPSKPNEEK